MIPELGLLALIVTLGLSICLSVFPFYGVLKNNVAWQNYAPTLAWGVFVFTAISYVCLSVSFYNDDFTVSYVANTSNSMLPWYYKLTAVWGGHEGAFLLWMLMMAGWMAAVATFSAQLTTSMRALVLSILGWIYIGFDLYILTVSSPFERLLPYYPVDGRDLNPLLQDFGMIIHPPMLYMGYVGFAVAFAFAVAALISGKLDTAWARWSRPWALAAWGFLTVGIALGSWWAYYELGWGGWWFWDPVENASLMPWIVGTALIHSLAVTEKRGVFKAWTLFLAIAAFSLSLLGTFLVRSGIIVSVHAFATDPSRGLFILVMLLIVIGGSLFLYSMRASQISSYAKFNFASREVALLGNNIFLVAATLVVLIGTMFPLVHKELGLGSISIGPPFFNQVFSVWLVPFALLLGLGPLIRWKRQQFESLKSSLFVMATVSVLLGFVLPFVVADTLYGLSVMGTLLSVWVIMGTVEDLRQKHKKGVSLGSLSTSHWGMVMGHVGFAVVVIGISVTSFYSSERDVRMNIGDSIELNGYRFVFDSVEPVQGPNYSAHQGIMSVYVGDRKVTELASEKRFYTVQRNVMTEAGVDSSFTRDLYIALGEQLKDGSWAMRVYVKPFIFWLWLGSALMALGSIMCLIDKRYRVKSRAHSPAPEGGVPA